MSSFTVLITGTYLVPEAQQRLHDVGAQLVFMNEPIDEDALVSALSASPVDVMLLRGPKPVTRRVLDAAPDLKLIAKNGAGVDSVDLLETERRGICVAVAPGANAHAVAEHTLAAMLALVRDLSGHDHRVRGGAWEGSTYQGRDFAGSVVGIIGFGHIGQITARMAEALGAHVVVFDPSGQACAHAVETDLDALLARIDILSLHCPLTDQTRGMIGARQLQSMKPGAFIVNTARGGLIDEHALAAALLDGHLGGAALDTLAVEPLDPASPLRQVPNIIFTPHIAGVTRQAAQQVASITAQNVVDYMQGRTLPARHIVCPGRALTGVPASTHAATQGSLP